MIHSGVIGFKLANNESRFPIFPIPYELSPCKDGRFNMETLWAGRILTPKRPIAANRYWIGLVRPARCSVAHRSRQPAGRSIHRRAQVVNKRGAPSMTHTWGLRITQQVTRGYQRSNLTILKIFSRICPSNFGILIVEGSRKSNR